MWETVPKKKVLAIEDFSKHKGDARLVVLLTVLIIILAVGIGMRLLERPHNHVAYSKQHSNSNFDSPATYHASGSMNNNDQKSISSKQDQASKQAETKTNSESEDLKTTPTQTAVAVIPDQNAQLSSNQQITAIAQAFSNSNAKLEKQLEAISSNCQLIAKLIDAQVKSIEALNGKLTEVQTYINTNLDAKGENKETTESFNKIENSLQSLQELSQKIVKAEEARDETKQLAAKKAMYQVYAIIPGRAWLKNKQGQIITVAEGDTLPECGRVVAIDPEVAIVTTSQGVVLR